MGKIIDKGIGYMSRLRIVDEHSNTADITVDHGAELNNPHGIAITTRGKAGGLIGIHAIDILENCAVEEFMGALGFLPDPAEASGGCSPP
mgnify:CR=1 FL=1